MKFNSFLWSYTVLNYRKVIRHLELSNHAPRERWPEVRYRPLPYQSRRRFCRRERLLGVLGFLRVSPSDQPLAREPEDSGYECLPCCMVLFYSFTSSFIYWNKCNRTHDFLSKLLHPTTIYSLSQIECSLGHRANFWVEECFFPIVFPVCANLCDILLRFTFCKKISWRMQYESRAWSWKPFQAFFYWACILQRNASRVYGGHGVTQCN